MAAHMPDLPSSSELIRQAMFLELCVLAAQRDAAQRQPCLQTTRYRRGRVLPRSTPIIFRLLARGAMPLKKSRLTTIWGVDEEALALHGSTDASSPWWGCKRGRTWDYLAPFTLHVSSLLAAPAARMNRVLLPPPTYLLLPSTEVLKRARFLL
jgi:hypothetical protein